MIDKHLMKLRARDHIDAAEEAFIRAGVSKVIEVPARTVAVPANQPLDFCTILLEGTACRQKDLRSGRRQITELQVPGDYTDLHSFTLKYLDHDVFALTACRLAVVPHAHLHEMTERHPHLTRLYWFSTNLDAAIHREWELSLGGRGAEASMAHLFCELHVRLDLVGLVENNSYRLPLTQPELGECLGISAVHVNRTLQELRLAGVVDFAGGQVTIHDFGRLAALGEFNPAYLYLGRRPG